MSTFSFKPAPGYKTQAPSQNEVSPSSAEFKAYQKYKRIICEKSSHLDIDFDRVQQGEQLRLITSYAVNAIVAIEKISQKYEIDEVYICVYRMNQRAVNWITDHLHQQGIKSTILLSNFFRENKRYEAWFNRLLELQNKNFIVKTGCLHAKVFCCRTKDGQHFVFEGSGNLSDNARLEQYIFEKNEDVYNFHRDWMLSYGE